MIKDIFVLVDLGLQILICQYLFMLIAMCLKHDKYDKR